jgi:hypothetical protein
LRLRSLECYLFADGYHTLIQSGLRVWAASAWLLVKERRVRSFAFARFWRNYSILLSFVQYLRQLG